MMDAFTLFAVVAIHILTACGLVAIWWPFIREEW